MAPVLVEHLEGPPGLLLGWPGCGHVGGHQELLSQRTNRVTIPPSIYRTVKVIWPSQSASNILKILSTKSFALDVLGRIFSYIFWTSALYNFPSGHLNLKFLWNAIRYFRYIYLIDFINTCKTLEFPPHHILCFSEDIPTCLLAKPSYHNSFSIMYSSALLS